MISIVRSFLVIASLAAIALGPSPSAVAALMEDDGDSETSNNFGSAMPFSQPGKGAKNEEVNTPPLQELPPKSEFTEATVSPSQSSTTPNPPGPKSLFEMEASSKDDYSANVQVRLSVPRMSKAVDSFMVYPYPVKPPRVPPLEPLPTEAKKGLKDLILASGYVRRSSPDRPYPMGGLRWQYAFKRAIARNGGNVPHTIATMYPWMHRVMPYVVAECERINKQEEVRYKRYEKFTADWERNHIEIENEATRAGLYPLPMTPRRSGGFAERAIAPGTWWVTCTRRVPGLTYYWQMPITAAPSETVQLVLNESNAMIITGGW